MCARELLKTKCVYLCVGSEEWGREEEEKEGRSWWLNSFQFSTSFLCHWAKTCRQYSSFFAQWACEVCGWLDFCGSEPGCGSAEPSLTITPAGNMAQSMLQLTILVSMDFSCLCLRGGGDTGSDIFSALSLQKDELCCTVLYLFVCARSLFSGWL